MNISDIERATKIARRTIQIWADLGLLKVTEETRKGGTGVHREFEAGVIEEALLLNLLHEIGVGNNHKAKLAPLVRYNAKLRSELEQARELVSLAASRALPKGPASEGAPATMAPLNLALHC